MKFNVSLKNMKRGKQKCYFCGLEVELEKVLLNIITISF